MPVLLIRCRWQCEILCGMKSAPNAGLPIVWAPYLYDPPLAPRAICPDGNSGRNSTSSAGAFFEMLGSVPRGSLSASSLVNSPAFWRSAAAPSVCLSSHQMPGFRCPGKRQPPGWRWAATTVMTCRATCCYLVGRDVCDDGCRFWRSSSSVFASMIRGIPCRISPAKSGHI